MKIPAKFSPFFSAALMSGMMSLVMSAISVLTIFGFDSKFPGLWINSFLHVWPSSFLIIFIVAPLVQWITSKAVHKKD